MDKLENWGSKYALVTLAAKRAKQLKSGAPPLIETKSVNPLTIALEEIAAGKIKCVVPDTDVTIQPSIEHEVAELLPIPTEHEEEAQTEAQQAEELSTKPEETASSVDIEDVEEELEPDELEEEEEEEEEEEVHDLLEEELVVDEHLLGPDDEAEVVVDPEIAAIAGPVLEDDEPKPRSRRGRKVHEDDIDIGIELPVDEVDIEEAHEDLD